eukprot:gene13870-biopygen17052
MMLDPENDVRPANNDTRPPENDVRPPTNDVRPRTNGARRGRAHFYGPVIFPGAMPRWQGDRPAAAGGGGEGSPPPEQLKPLKQFEFLATSRGHLPGPRQALLAAVVAARPPSRLAPTPLPPTTPRGGGGGGGLMWGGTLALERWFCLVGSGSAIGKADLLSSVTMHPAFLEEVTVQPVVPGTTCDMHQPTTSMWSIPSSCATSRAPRQPWEERQRTWTGRGPHDRIQRNGRGLDADRTRAVPFLSGATDQAHATPAPCPRHPSQILHFARATPAPVSCDPCWEKRQRTRTGRGQWHFRTTAQRNYCTHPPFAQATAPKVQKKKCKKTKLLLAPAGFANAEVHRQNLGILGVA